MAFGLNHQAMVDEILGRFTAAWTPTGHMCVYPDVPITDAQFAIIDGPGLEPWARLTVRTTERTQGAFGSGPDARRWDTVGIFFVEIYVPTGSGMTEAYSLGTTVLEAFEGVSTNNGVWYRNCKIMEAGAEGNWVHINCVIEFESQEYR